MHQPQKSILPLITFVLLLTGCQQPTNTNTNNDPFTTAFLAGNYKNAMTILDNSLAANAQDRVALTYRGTCLALLDRYEEALESFRLAETCEPKEFVDRTSIYLRALALFKIKAYGRSQETLDTLNKAFPHSRLAQRGQELALMIEKRLAKGINADNLNWYLNRGIHAYDSERPALATEYLEEYFLLAQRLKDKNFIPSQRGNLSLGGAYLELGNTDMALTYLNKVPTDYGEYRAGILTALALRADGQNKLAMDTIRKVNKQTDNATVKVQAAQYMEQWTMNHEE